jgi:exonuclease I
LIKNHPTFVTRIGQLLAARYQDQPDPAHVEERIYAGFPPKADQARFAAFHRAGWEERAKLIPAIEDHRYRELGQRILACESPELMSANQCTQWETFRRARFFPDGDVPWLTVSRALAEDADLSRNADAPQRLHLQEITEFLKNLN